jgi:hypothetical protein
MADLIEITELPSNSNNSKPIFGSGIELLMNDKVKDKKSTSSNIHLDDLNNLENELNELVLDDFASSNTGSNSSFNTFLPKSDMFSDKPSVTFKDDLPNSNQSQRSFDTSTPSFGTTEDNNKTWDGYDKFNNIPLNPDKPTSSSPQLSKEELLREKFKYLKKLESLEKKGVELSKKYNMESSLSEMIGEYESVMEEKTKQNSVKFQGNMLMAFVNGIEFLNNRFDPFDINLDGWSEQLNENVSDYDDVFGELYDKYKTRTSMAPELKLMFQLGGSAMMIHMTNTMFKSAMPGMDDILRQNPDLMKQFQTAAVNSMSQTNPGFSGFMNGVMNPQQDNFSANGNLPPPMATQGPTAIPTPLTRPGNNNYAERNDFRTNIQRNNFVDDGINFREGKTNEIQQKHTRAEMKGPRDISEILSGLKTKTINIQEQMQKGEQDNNSSTISISDLKELQGDGNIPKRSKRRTKSDKNTISLDL